MKNWDTSSSNDLVNLIKISWRSIGDDHELFEMLANSTSQRYADGHMSIDNQYYLGKFAIASDIFIGQVLIL